MSTLTVKNKKTRSWPLSVIKISSESQTDWLDLIYREKKGTCIVVKKKPVTLTICVCQIYVQEMSNQSIQKHSRDKNKLGDIETNLART